MALRYYIAFERKGRNLEEICSIQANNHEEALNYWENRYGGNYGRVVLIPAVEFDGTGVTAVFAKAAE